MDKPEQIILPVLYAGVSVSISWTPVDTAVKYIVERRFDKTFTETVPMTWREFNDMWALKTWQEFNADWDGRTWADFNIQEPEFIIYKGPVTQCQDFIREDAVFAVYRVRAVNGAGEKSPWTETEQIEVIQNRAPTIDGTDSDLGIKTKGFTVHFRIIDPDPEDIVSAIIYKDETEYQTIAVVQQNAQHHITYTDNEMFAFLDGSVHELKIVATDRRGLSAERIYTFTASEDYLSTATYYLLRKEGGQQRFWPIARMIEDTYSDYLSVGTNTYKVRAVDRYDNYYDSNEVTLTVVVLDGKLALAKKPEDMLSLKLRHRAKPERSKTQEYQFSEQYFEGRESPVHTFQHHIVRSMNLSFSHLSSEQKKEFDELLNTGGVFIYRDLYNEKMFGHVYSNQSVAKGSRLSPTHSAVHDYAVMLKETDYTEVIPYD